MRKFIFAILFCVVFCMTACGGHTEMGGVVDSLDTVVDSLDTLMDSITLDSVCTL